MTTAQNSTRRTPTRLALADLTLMLELHRQWLYGQEGGARANLRGANLGDADLRDADLRGEPARREPARRGADDAQMRALIGELAA